ncbi:OFA family MFS transporter [Aquibacillus koreensis]|uniref:OFA family MFS transporter n=1 Tax=Aquibacillus koreensis TaxID=279446 RepID=A0A9X3WKY3_9BACI|nr:OFA family MFS transporter [Aquibacillus koreensis]MCT2534222.1 OFA family MFS transporter [Aquibacillus koreensis]MDC3420733.1 OFA family MFS transporter [Aquibacillus koreensis]
MKKNRWLIALSAIAIHLSIGSTYAYSVFKNPMSDSLGWNSKEVTLSFTIAIMFLGLSAATLGKYVEKWGPRKSATLAAILFSAGLLGAGLAIQMESLILYYLTYGVIGGIGLGLGYISPVSTLVKWFPDRRGLATGMAVMGFGAGSLIASPVAASLIQSVGLSKTFLILGGSYLVLMLAGASYIVRPPEGWMPKGMTEVSDTKKKKRKAKADLSQLTANEAVKTKRFWLLWIMMFINISSGIMLISVASPMAQEKVGMSVVAAASMVGIMGLFNGLGRIGWASISDYLGRSNVFSIFFAVQMVLFLLLPMTSNPILFQIYIFIILSIYGGGFSSLPAFIGDLFGTKQLGAIHGYLLTAWSCAGVFGPMIVATINDATQSYNATFYIFAILLVVAFATSIIMRLNIKSIEKEALKATKSVA